MSRNPTASTNERRMTARDSVDSQQPDHTVKPSHILFMPAWAMVVQRVVSSAAGGRSTFRRQGP